MSTFPLRLFLRSYYNHSEILWDLCKVSANRARIRRSACYNERMTPWRSAVHLGFALLLIAGLAGSHSAAAQSGGTARITTLESEDFPQLSLYISVLDDRGEFISDLESQDLSVQEDGTPIQVQVLEPVRAGTRQIFALNTTAGFQLKDELGFRLYDHLRADLTDWWASQAASEYGVDDLTLIARSGLIISHSTLTAELAAELSNFEPTFEAEGSIADLLVEALSYTTNPSRQVGISNQLILISPPIEDPPELFLGDAIALASNSETVIHTIQISRQEDPEEPVPIDENLRELSTATGGTFTLYEPEEGLEALQQRVLSQRMLYRLSLRSDANTSGPHTISVAVNSGTVQIGATSVSYDLEVHPAEITFIQPPNRIERHPADPSNPVESLEPSSLSLEILVTFPDGHRRDLTFSRLTVDGEVVDENRTPPFDQFLWDLRGQVSTQTRLLQAVAMDSMGIETSTEEIPVLIEVPPPPGGLEALSPALEPLLIGLGVLVLGVLGATGLISLVRRRAQAPSAPRTAPSGNRFTVERASLRAPTHGLAAEAWLKPLPTGGEQEKPIPLTGAEVTLGSDASLSTIPVDDPSVSRLHAQLLRRAGGEYVIRDQNSVSGTWVNYEPVPEGGRRLQHEDLIHIGRTALRFELSAPPPPPQVSVQPVSPHLDSDSERTTENTESEV